MLVPGLAPGGLASLGPWVPSLVALGGLSGS